jgi:hypothetical protein
MYMLFQLRLCSSAGVLTCTLYSQGSTIKRRMIDIGKRITFYFFLYFRKYTVFSHLHSSLQKCHYEPKYFFLKKKSIGVSKRRIFMLILNSLMPTLKLLFKKSKVKTMDNFSALIFSPFFKVFCLEIC